MQERKEKNLSFDEMSEMETRWIMGLGGGVGGISEDTLKKTRLSQLFKWIIFWTKIWLLKEYSGNLMMLIIFSSLSEKKI